MFAEFCLLCVLSLAVGSWQLAVVYSLTVCTQFCVWIYCVSLLHALRLCCCGMCSAVEDVLLEISSGYILTEGTDFDEICAPTARLGSIRVACMFKLKLI